MGERQEEKIHVAFANEAEAKRRFDRGEVIAVCLDDALRGAGRARRVDDCCHVVAGERGYASLDLGPEPRQGSASPLDERPERPLPVRIVDRDDPAQIDLLSNAVELEAPGRHLVDLDSLLRVLHQCHRRLGIGDDVAALAGQTRLVDRDGEGTARENGQVDLDPLGTRRGQDGDAVAGAYAVVHERRGGLEHADFHLPPSHLSPAVPDAIAVARAARQLGGPREEHLREIDERHPWRSDAVPYNR